MTTLDHPQLTVVCQVLVHFNRLEIVFAASICTWHDPLQKSRSATRAASAVLLAVWLCGCVLCGCVLRGFVVRPAGSSSLDVLAATGDQL